MVCLEHKNYDHVDNWLENHHNRLDNNYTIVIDLQFQKIDYMMNKNPSL
jgi:hypothetical protein